jgi:hypothetical protein
MKRVLGLVGLLLLVVGVTWIWDSGLLAPSGGEEKRVVGADREGLVPSAFADPIPDCPAIFAVCDDTFGRNCNFSTMCTTTDTGNHRCKKPDGSIFHCQGNQSIFQQNCPCRDVFHLTCCDDETCGPCPACEAQPGSQTYFCI